MCLFVTGVSMLIHLYSIGYMQSDRDYSKFFIYLNLFVFSMLVLVLANNLLVTFVGWEGVGVCSYWLVSFWFERDTAASAGKKAFIYNRVGDVGFLIAMFLIFSKVGSLNYLAASSPTRHLLVGRRRHGRRAAAVPGGLRQVGPDPAVQLAARRHGGPDAGLGPHPRGHHGHRRGLPAVPDEPAARHCRPTPRGSSPASAAATAFVGGHHRHLPAGHQEGPGLLDGVPDRLHGAGRGHRRLHRRHLPDGLPRLLQGPALLGRRARSSTAWRTSRT